MRGFITYASPNITRMLKTRRMSWAGHVARTIEMRNANKIWWESLKGRDHLDDLGVDERIILEGILWI
jgi:hypothetical protein